MERCPHHRSLSRLRLEAGVRPLLFSRLGRVGLALLVGLTLFVVSLSPPLRRFLVPVDLGLLVLVPLRSRLGLLGHWIAIGDPTPSPSLRPAGFPRCPAPPWHQAGGVSFCSTPYIIVDLSSPPQLPGQHASEFFLAFLYSTELLLHLAFIMCLLLLGFSITPTEYHTLATLAVPWWGGGYWVGGGIRGFQIPRPSGATVGKLLGGGVSWAASWAICSARPRRAHYHTSTANLLLLLIY